MMQQTGMREAEREAFLQAFSGEASKRRVGSLVAFCVLGGIFGEGIDLKKEQLIGAVIVGTGLDVYKRQQSHRRRRTHICSRTLRSLRDTSTIPHTFRSRSSLTRISLMR